MIQGNMAVVAIGKLDKENLQVFTETVITTARPTNSVPSSD